MTFIFIEKRVYFIKFIKVVFYLNRVNYKKFQICGNWGFKITCMISIFFKKKAEFIFQYNSLSSKDLGQIE